MHSAFFERNKIKIFIVGLLALLLMIVAIYKLLLSPVEVKETPIQKYSVTIDQLIEKQVEIKGELEISEIAVKIDEYVPVTGKNTVHFVATGIETSETSIFTQALSPNGQEYLRIPLKVVNETSHNVLTLKSTNVSLVAGGLTYDRPYDHGVKFGVVVAPRQEEAYYYEFLVPENSTLQSITIGNKMIQVNDKGES